MTLVVFVVIAAFGALVLDLGNLYAAHQQAQDSADTAALSRALDCAKNVPTGSLGAFMVSGVTTNPPGAVFTCDADNTVTVKTQKQIPFVLAGVLGQHSGTAHAQATATWSGAGSADTIPLVLSECDFQRITAGGMPSGTQTVYFHSETVNTSGPFPCNASSSGLNLPGGFGWIGSGGCIAHVTLSTPSDSGNSPPNSCKTQPQWQAMVGQDFLIPIYDKIVGQNYQIAGFAEFTFQGFKWNGNNNSGGTLLGKLCPDPVTGADMGTNVTCLQGSFKKTVTASTVGGGFNFGATVVYLIK
jgi:hypothetical protein